LQTPLKNLKTKTNSVSILKELIPKGTIVGTYPFYDGNVEFRLAESDRFVIGNTQSRAVAEFWYCAVQDPARVCLIADKISPMLNEATFDILRKRWYAYKDPFARSALFFLLNRCSSLGMVSHGDFSVENFSPMATRDLKTLQTKNFSVRIVQEYEQKEAEINLFSPGKYHFDVLDIEEPKGIEESQFRHTKMLKQFSKKPTIFVYEYHPRLPTIKGYSKILIDQYGRKTKDVSTTKEIILYNV
tara:strand:+ start:1270 stop:2001 length:732 start_codon:yes stop_codon:yes gene_type:complete